MVLEEAALDLGSQQDSAALVTISTLSDIQFILISDVAVFSASFGPGGFRTTRTSRRGNQQAAANAEPRSVLIQLLPLLILFAFSFLSAIPSLFSTPPVPDPRYSFTGTSRYNAHLETGSLGVSYYVNPSEFTSHPVIGPELAKDGIKIGKHGEEKRDGKADGAKVKGKGKKRGPAVTKFEETVERTYTHELYADCQNGVNRKERLKDAEMGLFGIGVDWEKVKKIENEPVASCQRLKELGVLR